MKRLKYPTFWTYFLFLSVGCGSPTEWNNQWQLQLDIGEEVIPFNIEVRKAGELTIVDFINGEEVLTMDETRVEGDCLSVNMGVFDAELKLKKSGSTLSGTYFRRFEGDYRLPVTGSLKAPRFEPINQDYEDFSGTWEVSFSDEDGSFPAIGDFDQQDRRVHGTFRTETGDYRFLEGIADGRELKLSVFDGSHAFLFRAKKQKNGSLKGGFWSGKHYYASWTAVKNEQARLTHPDSLTYLRPGYENLAFSFPNVQGDTISLTDFKGKPTIVQLLGTWCPNCMDETLFLTEWLQKNVESDVQLVGLAYEYKDNFNYARSRIEKMTARFSVPYPILAAGSRVKSEASKTLPMLNRIVSFPTLIFLNKDHRIVRIHTGFNGPGTGIHYDQFKKEFEKTIGKIID